MERLNDLIERYPALTACADDIHSACEQIIRCYENGGKLLLCGNGGSCADCDHIVGELTKGFLSKRPLSEKKKAEMKERFQGIPDSSLELLQDALAAISLSSAGALNSAFSNDVEPELVYAQGVLALAKPADTLIAISTSGNSKNILRAAEVAKALGVTVVALTGSTGGGLFEIADVCIRVPECETYKVQELHLPVYHYICAAIEAHFFD